MPFDAVTVGCVADELEDSLKDGRIDKIYMPSRSDIILNIRVPGRDHENAHGENKRLLISCNPSFPRVHFTRFQRENPSTAPGFCMLLRKHLANGKFICVTQPENERIIEFTIETRNELGDLANKKLIVELFGKNSNIILLHETGLIADCVRHVDSSLSRERIVLPGLPYFPPPPQNKISPKDVTLELVKSMLSSCDQTKKADAFILENFAGLSPLICREIVYLWGSDSDLGIGSKSGLADTICFYMDKLAQKKYTPVLLWDKNKPADFSCIEIRQYAGALTVAKVSKLTEALDDFFVEKERKNLMKDKGGTLLKTVDTLLARCWKKAALQEESVLAANGCEKYKLKGDLIIANIYKLQKGDRTLVTENFYDEKGGEISIALDHSLTPSENAQKFYSRYNKLKNTAAKAQIQYAHSLEDIHYIESVQNSLTQCDDPKIIDEIREELEQLGYIHLKPSKGKKKPPSRVTSPSEFCSRDGFTIYVGKNNRQNDYLTLKMSSSKDIWFHTKGFPGSHTVVISENKQVPDTTLYEAACLAAYYSKARGSSQIPVDYCPVKNVKKPSGAKPGMVIYDNYNTAYVTPNEDEIIKLKV
ncbi:MAG: NFACT RNA binding domain-containing protein [Bacillota bacterium]|nr:NFACT RNA binding domain-containing protein [Bacillota bacterium]